MEQPAAKPRSIVEAAVHEVRTAPIATLGAFAGIASFVVVLAAPLLDSQPLTGTPSAAHAAFAFVQLALVIPGTAFFFAFLGSLFIIGGSIRGTFVTLVLFLIAEAFSAAVAGVILSPFPVTISKSAHDDSIHHVLGIDLFAVSFVTFLVILFIFAGVIGETLYTRQKEANSLAGKKKTRSQSINDDAWTFLANLFFFGFLGAAGFAASFVHAVFKGSIGAF